MAAKSSGGGTAAGGASKRAQKQQAGAAAAGAAAKGGPAAGAGVYLKERHSQKRQGRARNKQLRQGGKQAAQDSAQRARGTRAAGRAPRAFLTKDLPRRALLAEFAVCVIVVMAGTVVAPDGSKDNATRMMVKLSGLAALFFVLALVSAGGPGPAKAAGSLGALVTLSYVVSSSDAINLANWAGKFFSPAGVGGQRANPAPAPAPPAPAQPTPAQAAA